MAASKMVIECICALPRRLKLARTKTMFQILEQHQVFEQLSNVTNADIEQYLRDHSDLIDDWLMYSEDQRCTPSLYFMKRGAVYEIARYPGGIKTQYSDPVKACTAFVTRYIDQLVDIH